jgi:hypothetical protein
VTLLRKAIGVALVVIGVLFVRHANRRRRGPRLQSRRPMPGWVYLLLGVRTVVENPTERDLEIEGTLAEGIGGAAAVVIGIALIVIHG